MSRDEKIHKLSHENQWLRLLHYNRRFPFWQFHSVVDGKDFFFAPNGGEDPEAEMRATIEAFGKNIEHGRNKNHPQCAFPVRYEFLRKELGSVIAAPVACPKLDTFMSNFSPKSATLIFSSAYPNNPASIFGHTLIRVNSRPSVNGEHKLDMLDKSINFAAHVPPDAGSFEFMWRGLTGGYYGRFSLIPYYAKLNEYTNSESRDLWEYDINLTEEETIRLIKHTWELEANSDYEYYFLDENCSYMMLELLEAVKPEWRITDVGIDAIPGETVKKLTDIPGAITNVVYRPSLQKKLMYRYAKLSSEQKTAFSQMMKGSVDPTAITDTGVIDAATTYYYYEKQKNDGKLSDEKAEYLKRTLIRRSQLGQVPEDPIDHKILLAQENTRPDQGHHAMRLGTSGGLANSNYFQELQYKFAYHDLMNDDTGYKRFSHVSFPEIRLRYYATSAKFNLEEFYGVGVTSLFPMNFLEKRISWKMEIKYHTPKDFGCLDCHAANFQSGIGATVNLFSPRYIFYTLGLINFETAPSLRKGFRFNPGLRAAVMMHPIGKYKIAFVANAMTDLFQDDRRRTYYEYNVDQSLGLSQEWDVRLSTQYILPYREAKLTLNYYF